MNITFLKRGQQQGSVLLTVVIIGAVMCISIGATLTLSSNSVKNSHGRVDWNKAYYTSESAMVWATQHVLDGTTPPAGITQTYSLAGGNLPVAQLVSGGTNGDVTLKGAWVTVAQLTNMPANSYVVTASSRVNNKVRTLQASITAYPVSTVFDYEYFLNNWGWWWGTPIYGQGGQRSNWYFDFQGGRTVNGLLYANPSVEENEVPYVIGTPAPFAGLAAADPIKYVHDGAPRVTMPNLMNFSNYIATAMANTSSNGIWIGSTQVVAGVVNNGSVSGVSGIYLVGTSAQPIQIKGTVVVPGDVVIQGVVTGQGTLYVGGDLYIANNLTYKNGPNYVTPPETMADTNRDAWVASNQTKDLVAYAVNGSVFGGDVTSGDWISYEYNYPGSGLASVGDESHLGADGILGTGDDNIPFLHADGTTSTWYDADGNGVVNHNYIYATDINMTTARANAIQGYPTAIDGTPVAYSTIATDDMGSFDGIFYTDHAMAIRSAAGSTTFHGAVISRNEQIVFNSVCNFIYDSRVNSRYHNNPNDIINLGLPYGKTLAVNSMVELAPKLHRPMMIRHAVRSISLIGFSVIAMMLAMAFPAKGVGLPLMPDQSDTNAMEQFRIKVFYEAQKSQEEKLKVGQQRYDTMLTNRAKALAAMAAELADRHKEVVLQPEPTPESNAGNQESNTWMVTTVGAALIGLGFLGFRYYLSRLDLRDTASQKRSKSLQI